MPLMDDAISGTGDGVILSLEVSAGSKKNRFPAGFNPWRKAVACQVTAPPVHGKANAAVLALIAETFDIPVIRLQVRSGASSPMKKVFIQGISKPELVRKLSDLA